MLIVVGAVAFAVALLTLFSGFGLGTLLMPTLALFFPASTAVLLTAVVHGCNSLFKLALLWRDAAWSVVWRFGIPAALTAGLGAGVLALLTGLEPLYTWSPPLDPLTGRLHHWEVTPVELLLGLLILAFAALDISPARKKLRFDPKWLPLGGAIAGFFGGLSGHQGALRAAFLVPLGLQPRSYAATQAVLASIVDIVRLAGYAVALVAGTWQGLGGTEQRQVLVVATICALTGSLVGKSLLSKVTVRGVRWLTASLLLIVGLGLVSGAL